LLRRKHRERLGKNGIYELKDHSWLKNIPWTELYKKELISPYIPKVKILNHFFNNNIK